MLARGPTTLRPIYVEISLKNFVSSKIVHNLRSCDNAEKWDVNLEVPCLSSNIRSKLIEHLCFLKKCPFSFSKYEKCGWKQSLHLIDTDSETFHGNLYRDFMQKNVTEANSILTFARCETVNESHTFSKLFNSLSLWSKHTRISVHLCLKSWFLFWIF